MVEQAKPRARTAAPRKAKAGPEPLPNTPDPIEIALDAESGDVSAESPARALLREQAALIRQQAHHLKLQAVSERASVGLKLLTGLVGLVAAGVLGVMVWNAAHDRSLVIQAFNTPPELQERGLTGEVVAAKLLDRLAEIDAHADSLRAPETFRNDWGDDIQIEIPQTGVSIGELDRYLRQWLGKRTGIGGEIVRNADGTVAVTVRVGSSGAATATGAEADLDALLQKAAEAVFERTQPFRYSKYLEQQRRMDEAMAVVWRLAQDGPEAERPWAWAQISNLNLEAGNMAAAAWAGREAVRLDPNVGLGWLNLSIAEQALGHDRVAYEAVARSVELLTSGKGQLSKTGVAVGYANASVMPAQLGDIREAYARAVAPEARTSYMGAAISSPAFLVFGLAAQHDLAAAKAKAGALSPDSDPAWLTNQIGNSVPPHALMATYEEDWSAVRDNLRSMLETAAPFGSRYAVVTGNSVVPILAMAEARTGNLAEARRLADGLADDCAACLEAKAWVAELSGDRVAADRWFGRWQPFAVGPFAPASWGQAKLARGDLQGALVLFRQARQQGPKWADGFKLEGDVLMRQGRAREAAEAYREAVKRAPKWGGAWLRLSQALTAAGDRREARDAAAEAHRLVLIPGDLQPLSRAGPPTQPS